jgi:hypothetical protein
MLGLGTLMHPYSLSSVNIHEMYQQCSQEDHDITPLDFVFEHLLNLEHIINFFEGENEQEHQPYQSAQPSAHQLVMAMPIYLGAPVLQHRLYAIPPVYPCAATSFYRSLFLGSVFRPPLV